MRHLVRKTLTNWRQLPQEREIVERSGVATDGSPTARRTLIRVLQDAHAGELAAAYAYRGHWHSLWKRSRVDERTEIRRIEGTEWHHRDLVAQMLIALQSRPRRRREVLMLAVGRFFGFLCFVSGYFWPMYMAGRLEAMNVGQYLTARSAAEELGRNDDVDSLEAMRAEEDRHERFFGDCVRGHWLLPVARAILGWAPPQATSTALHADLPPAGTD